MRSTDILIVDDEIGIREVLQETLEDEGYTVSLAANAGEARAMRNKNRPALVLLDIWMPDSDGITLLKEWAKNGQLTMPVIMMSGHGSIDTAVEATKIGALDFLEKPIPLQKLLQTVERALKQSETADDKSAVIEGLGNSAVIQNFNQQIKQAQTHNNAVLLIGETGSPFEIIARFFHKENTPWVQPTRPEQIIDIPSELLNKATNGVLYLGDISQSSKNIRQGIAFLTSKADKHNTRIVFTSSRPLNELLDNSQSDTRLMSVLSSAIINIPALRQHSEDIPFIVNKLLNEIAPNRPVKFAASAMNRLRQYDWPGNFEQLKNVVNSLVLNCEQNEISDVAVSRLLNQFNTEEIFADIRSAFNFNLPLRELREELERRYFEFHIRQENHNMSHVAQKVGLERTHLYRKLKQLGITFSRRTANNGEKESSND
ncbi:sigma-54-dependent transcriptional regulator [Kingella oralis]|uniref:sigma-54-dependent transcriptional regulator n=1 Tax=Kingella oralis TaxID=505 RepID=UPI003C6F6164